MIEELLKFKERPERERERGDVDMVASQLITIFSPQKYMINQTEKKKGISTNSNSRIVSNNDHSVPDRTTK